MLVFILNEHFVSTTQRPGQSRLFVVVPLGDVFVMTLFKKWLLRLFRCLALLFFFILAKRFRVDPLPKMASSPLRTLPLLVLLGGDVAWTLFFVGAGALAHMAQHRHAHSAAAHARRTVHTWARDASCLRARLSVHALRHVLS